MAHFAEIDSNNRVLRVIKISNDDVQNNGGDGSEQAAEYVKTLCELKGLGVKWVQTSYNTKDGKYYVEDPETRQRLLGPDQSKAFRGNFAGIGFTYDPIKDKFIRPQPYASWTLDSNDIWQAPVAKPETTYTGSGKPHVYDWNEETLSWDNVGDPE